MKLGQRLWRYSRVFGDKTWNTTVVCIETGGRSAMEFIERWGPSLNTGQKKNMRVFPLKPCFSHFWTNFTSRIPPIFITFHSIYGRKHFIVQLVYNILLEYFFLSTDNIRIIFYSLGKTCLPGMFWQPWRLLGNTCLRGMFWQVHLKISEVCFSQWNH